MSRELATILEGKNWIVASSKNPNLRQRHFNELIELYSKFEEEEADADKIIRTHEQENNGCVIFLLALCAISSLYMIGLVHDVDFGKLIVLA